MKLSHTQIKEADRVGGIELMIPWPAGLPCPDDLRTGETRGACPTEHLAAMQMLAAECEAHDLTPVRVSVAVDHAPRSRRDAEPFLAVVIIGRRWVHARTSRQPKIMWAAP